MTNCVVTNENCYKYKDTEEVSCCCASRFFEIVPDKYRVFRDAEITLPFRATKNSACYDICSPCEVKICAHSQVFFSTDVRAYMQPGEVLLIFPRSSMGKIPMRLCNGTGVIDSDYYDNPSNGGNIGVMLQNMSDEDIVIKPGDRVCQAMFVSYLTTTDDVARGTRHGGFGSTGV